MKNIKFMYSRITLLTGLLFVILMSCERDISDQTEFATLSKTGEIFTDSPVGLGSDFYFPYTGSKATAWSVDENEGYESQASMRFDVPNANDPDGNFAGGILRVDGSGRDLTEFDALTFWAKASQGVVIGAIGFGQDFGLNQYEVSESNLSFSSNWTKFVIPIPDPSKLFDERGMFWYSAGTDNTGGSGYTFWIDELKFERLGTIGQPRPAILNGEDLVQDAFSGIDLELSGLTQTFNLGSGLNKTINVAPSYFDFTSSDPSSAFVNQFGVVSVSVGSSVITASLGGVEAEGSLTLNATGGFEDAPTPTTDSDDVISVFSDAYENVPVEFYNGYWQPYQTTEGGEVVINGQNVIHYTNFNFVGTKLVTPLDISEMTHFSIDILMPVDLPTDIDMLVVLKNENTEQTTLQQQRIGGQTYQWSDQTGDINDTESNATFEVGGVWKTIKIPLRPTSETGLDKTGVNIIIIENIKSSNVTELHVDNMYFFREQ
jgi:hypothetical protein